VGLQNALQINYIFSGGGGVMYPIRFKAMSGPPFRGKSKVQQY